MQNDLINNLNNNYEIKQQIYNNEDLKPNVTIKEFWQDKGNDTTQQKSKGKWLALGDAELKLQENEIIYSEEQYKLIYKFIDEVKTSRAI